VADQDLPSPDFGWGFFSGRSMSPVDLTQKERDRLTLLKLLEELKRAEAVARRSAKVIPFPVKRQPKP
jgi:hypothetical protein